jgi:hypothetical protein
MTYFFQLCGSYVFQTSRPVTIRAQLTQVLALGIWSSLANPWKGREQRPVQLRRHHLLFLFSFCEFRTIVPMMGGRRLGSLIADT